MEFDLNYKIGANNNNLTLLTNIEKDQLVEYLFTLNENIRWYDIIKKHETTNNEKFIKHIKSLTWEDHDKNANFNIDFELKGNSKCKNIFNRLSDLIFTLKPNQKNIIYIPKISSITINFIYDYVDQIKVEYEEIKNVFNFDIEILETNDIKLLTEFIQNNFPISIDNSEIYNKLIYSIFVNINSDEFEFDNKKI